MGKRLVPFFCYYGGKWRSAPRYPVPEHDTIIEPFAGAAGYSTRYSDRRVILVERDPVVAALWRYLVRVSPAEIRLLPDVPDGATTDDLSICPEARALVGFWLNKGASSPRKSPSAWMRSGIRPASYWGQAVRERLASQVEYIRHWQIIEDSRGRTSRKRDVVRRPTVRTCREALPPPSRRLLQAFRVVQRARGPSHRV